MLLKGDYVVVDNTSSNLNKKLCKVVGKVETYHSRDKYKVEVLDPNVNYKLWEIERNNLRFIDHKALIDMALAMKDEAWFHMLQERFKVIK